MLDLLRKHSTKITLGAFLAFAVYQRTTDGLWFWCALAYLVAKRFEATQNGEPFIKGKSKKQSILDFGIYNTIISFFLWEERENDNVPKRIFRRVFGVFFLCLILMHVYIAVIIGANYFLPDITNKYLNITTSRFIFLLDYWKGFYDTKQGLIAHGYAHRVPLVAHVYLLVMVVWIVSSAYSLMYCFRPDRLNSFYKFIKKRQENTTKVGQSQTQTDQYPRRIFGIKNRIVALYFVLCPAYLIMATFNLWFCWIISLSVVYPGDKLDYHQLRWVWLIGDYIYKDDMGLFFPSYFIYAYLMIATFLFIFVVFEYSVQVQTIARKILGKQISE